MEQYNEQGNNDDLCNIGVVCDNEASKRDWFMINLFI